MLYLYSYIVCRSERGDCAREYMCNSSRGSHWYRRRFTCGDSHCVLLWPLYSWNQPRALQISCGKAGRAAWSTITAKCKSMSRTNKSGFFKKKHFHLTWHVHIQTMMPQEYEHIWMMISQEYRFQTVDFLNALFACSQWHKVYSGARFPQYWTKRRIPEIERHNRYILRVSVPSFMFSICRSINRPCYTLLRETVRDIKEYGFILLHPYGMKRHSRPLSLVAIYSCRVSMAISL